MKRSDSYELVLAAHPTPRGFAWVVFETPTFLLDWGIAFITTGDRHAAVLSQVGALIDRFRPETLVLEVPRPGASIRAVQFSSDLVVLASERFVDVALYTRADINRALTLSDKAPLSKLVAVVADHMDGLRHRRPRDRRAWDGQDRRAGLFVAAGLALTHYVTTSAQPSLEIPF